MAHLGRQVDVKGHCQDTSAKWFDASSPEIFGLAKSSVALAGTVLVDRSHFQHLSFQGETVPISPTYYLGAPQSRDPSLA